MTNVEWETIEIRTESTPSPLHLMLQDKPVITERHPHIHVIPAPGAVRPHLAHGRPKQTEECKNGNSFRTLMYYRQTKTSPRPQFPTSNSIDFQRGHPAAAGLNVQAWFQRRRRAVPEDAAARQPSPLVARREKWGPIGSQWVARRCHRGQTSR